MEMESSIPIVKRVWSLVRVAFFMLRKGVSKGKLMMDLNMMLKRRRKTAGKVISNLMFPHHHDGSSHLQYSGQREYEFSCSNTPNNFFLPVGSSKRHRQSRHTHQSHAHLFACAHAPPTQDDEVVVKAVLAMLNNDVMIEASSPALPGFGRSPMVRQLRVTDSPFPLRDTDEDHQVDKAAEEFIKKFYKELKNQS
ncbi:uncharacterized protein LOC114715476 [Neltuma alba]|uniref:uncharacterized protein LOC114715476 n=1 Tax=Neltuma alba TaxID=207710 RepID=UPI0010A4646E|nr:uncharacterized protein LOC114715476 [Prosopis alba]